jgi:hypothetical protein
MDDLPHGGCSFLERAPKRKRKISWDYDSTISLKWKEMTEKNSPLAG